MFIDASAIVAILAREDEAAALFERLYAARRRLTSPIAVYEATTGLARRRGYPVRSAKQLVSEFLRDMEIVLVEIGEAEQETALDAFERYGKGRHPAGLSMGDCFAYACARTHGAPLLCKGDDFPRTDIEIA